jgi:diaminohydroxyphosphoribosylaminopyrimidine deaminase/5-amino-6-(5-phosphoribosylamino)uracil reductase
MASASRQGEDVRGATMYVTLEPCNHTGKQPPCVDAILAAGIARVVYARVDPGEASSGGAARLRQAGVEVERTGVSDLAVRASDPFFRRVGGSGTGRPWVIAKWAQTIDGRIATRTGESKWISGEASRRRVHRLRGRVDAVLTGLGTVVADDPTLTARGVRVRRVAARVVVDTALDIPLESKLVRTAREAPVIVACDEAIAKASITKDKRQALQEAGVKLLGVPEGDRRGNTKGMIDLELMLQGLLARGISTVLVEAGSGLVGSLMEQDLVDELRVYVAPLLLGDDMARSAAGGRVVDSLTSGRRFELLRVKRVGDDVELSYG